MKASAHTTADLDKQKCRKKEAKLYKIRKKEAKLYEIRKKRTLFLENSIFYLKQQSAVVRAVQRPCSSVGR